MTCEAVVFDLFGTLVPEFATSDWRRAMSEMAEVLGVDVDGLEREWSETSRERQTGGFPSPETNLRVVCERLGAEPGAGGIERAQRIRQDVYRGLFAPRPDAVGTLRMLKEGGLATGLISNCAPEAPALWWASPMASHVDVALLSTEVGLMKPDPDIYLMAAERLGVAPSGCLYVGDGGSYELAGAAAVGMDPVLLRDTPEVATDRPEADGWTGRSIGALSEIPRLLGLPR